MKFFVTVVIPAFNVEKLIEKAVISALQQPEVVEVVVVNDGSTDKTEIILADLQSKDSKIQIFHHENKSNKGRSASRNLGIFNAKGNFIAFLDADDFYLSKRFEKDRSVFEENEKVEVVYNAVGYHFYRELKESEKKYFQKLNTVSKPLEDNGVFESLISSKFGYLHLNGLTVKKSVFDKIGLFDETLKVAEDSDIIFKMGLKCRFKAGLIDTPVAHRGIHEENIYNDENLYKKWNTILYESLLTWCYNQGAKRKKIDTVIDSLWVIKFREDNTLIEYLKYWLGFTIRHPQTIWSIFVIKYFPILRLRKKLFPFFYRQ